MCDSVHQANANLFILDHWWHVQRVRLFKSHGRQAFTTFVIGVVDAVGRWSSGRQVAGFGKSQLSAPAAAQSLDAPQEKWLEAVDSTDSQTSSPPPHLPPSHLKLTTVESFWTSVETSAAMGKPPPATVNYIQSNNPDEPLLLPLKKTVIILPRIVTR
ncbi:TPA: hypothetical protein ACH3X1_012794 [Trebouxia sp. C0004]